MSLTDHLTRYCLQGEKCSCDVDRKQTLNAVAGDVDNGSQIEQRGVVNQDIQLTCLRNDGGDCTIDGRLVGDVHLDGVSVRPELGSRGLSALQIDVGDGDRCPFTNVRNLARTRAEDLKGTGIRVNVLSPGPTATELAKEALGEEGMKVFASMNPLQRMADPAEIGAAAAFLASQDSSFMTASEVAVDGGLAQI